MKKYLFLPFVVAMPIFLAGCSLTSTDTSDTDGTPEKSNDSIWESIDSGGSWQAKAKPDLKVDLAGLDVISMVVNPYDAMNVYVGLRGAGILKTNDGGENWEYLNFQSEKVYGLDLDPLDGKIIYASGVWQNRGKIFKSFDAGVTWKEIYTSPSVGPLVVALVVDKKNPNIIYVSTSDKQVMKSTDGGTSWKNIFIAPTPAIKFAIDKANSSLIYLLTQGREIFKSIDGGQNFEDMTDDVFQASKGSQDINVLETDPSNSGWVYLAGGAGILRSKDGGKSWEKLEILNDPQNFPVRALAVNPSNSREIIYGSAQATYKSVDGGINWITSQFEVSRSISIIKYSVADPNRIYLGLSK